MEKDLILAIDVGTTYLKVGLVDAKGRLIRTYRSRIKMETDETGKAEHNPKHLSKLLLRSTKRVVEGFEKRIAAIVPSTYIFGLMVVDQENSPVTNLITLADTRARNCIHDFRKDFNENYLYSRTGIPPSFHTALVKLFWLRKTLGLKDTKDAKFISCKDYLIFLLTSKLLTEPSTASSTGYFNRFTLEWDEEILKLLGISKGNLPDIVSPETSLQVSKEISEYLGLSRDVKVVMGLYDGGAVAVSSGIFGGVRKAVINLGTTGMIRVMSDKPVVSENSLVRLQNLYFGNGNWFSGGSVNNAGLVIEWLKRVLKINLDNIGEYKVRTDEHLIFYPYLTGERGLEFGNEARGILCGLEYKHSAVDILFAALEGISYTLRMMIEPLVENEVKFDRVCVSGSGANLKEWIFILSNVFNKVVEVFQLVEPALVGSAIFGSVVLGWYSSLTEATEQILSNEKIVEPQDMFVKIFETKYRSFIETMRRVYVTKQG